MILCICLSPALDVTYHLPVLTSGEAHRVSSVATRPGGKGVNVARVLRAVGEEAHVLAPVGGLTGSEFEQALTDAVVTGTLVRGTARTRRTVTVVEGGGAATVLSEPAALDRWEAVSDAAAELIPHARAVVISGAVPVGVPAGGLGELVELAHRSGVPSIVDTSGPALGAALAARPTMVKPNADELAGLSEDPDPARAVATLSAHHAVAVVASLGVDGVVAATPERTWLARPAETVVGNPTGAGDALVAALARFLARGDRSPEGWRAALVDGVALSAAAVRCEAAGEVDLDTYRDHLRRVHVDESVAR